MTIVRKLAAQKKLLIVDDEPMLRESIAYEFRKRGYEVLEASSGDQAFDLFQNNSVDGIISDIRMANGTGVELLEKVRQVHPILPVFFLISGYSDVHEISAIKKGALILMEKPIDRKSMIELV
jgi:DNA-binding NtrC family response regulator